MGLKPEVKEPPPTPTIDKAPPPGPFTPGPAPKSTGPGEPGGGDMGGDSGAGGGRGRLPGVDDTDDDGEE